MDNIKNITLYCPACGNKSFVLIDDIKLDLVDAPDETKIKCSNCNKIFTKAQFIEGNQYIINENIKDIKNELMQEFKNSISKVFKIKWFYF